MKLSLIIPYYNTTNLLIKLLDTLDKQMQPNIEVIVVDDCSDIPILVEYDWLRVIRLNKNSGGASKPRNVGLDNAKGEYIGFLDSDDLVTDNYIEEILHAITRGKDIIYLSWKSTKHNIIIDKKPPKWNCAVWCRIYRRSLIGNIRFREDLVIAEDWDFNRKIKPFSSTIIKKQVYIYNIRENSLTRRKNGQN